MVTMRVRGRVWLGMRRFGPVIFMTLLLMRSEVALYACRSAANGVARRMLVNIGVYEDPGTPVLRETLHGHEVMYQAPTGEVRGVLFVAHGCQHSAGDFFLRSEDCPTCLGLPEERRIVLRALNRGYAVVAISSLDRHTRCWHAAKEDRDLQPVADILAAVQGKEGWMDKPMYALGASSGGAFVLALPLTVDLAGISPQIMGLGEQHLRYVLQHMKDKVLPRDEHGKPKADGVDPSQLPDRPYPPTFFQHMIWDKLTVKSVALNMDVLQSQGISVREITVESQPLYPHYFSDRIVGFPQQLSEGIVGTLKEHGLIGAKGYLKRDPRSTARDWQWLIREKVQGFNEEEWPLQPDESGVHEELNIAYAGHEIISDYVDEMFDWWESLQQQQQQQQQMGSK